MKRVGLEIKLLSPLVISDGPPMHNLIESLDFIPGSTIRGALAYRFLERGGDPASEAFSNVFFSEKVRYGFAFLDGALPLPLSARTCKYNGGFIKGDDSAGHHEHGVVDILFTGQSRKECPQCGNPIDYFEGYYDPENHVEKTVKRKLITQTAIDPIRGSAAAEKLFSQRTVQEEQTFYSTVEYSEDCKDTLLSLFDKAFDACLGKGRSRGQGWVKISPCEVSDWPASDTVTRYRQLKKNNLLMVTLLSDGLFHDRYLRNRSAPKMTDLESLGIKSEEWEHEFSYAFSRQRTIFGFDGFPLQLPRIPRLAVSAGSVFVFRATDTKSEPTIPDGDGVGWIGDRNNEGFGRAILWHPFHLAHIALEEDEPCIQN